MATIPSTYSTVFWNTDAALYKTANQANVNGTDTAYTMQDVIDTVNIAAGAVAGSGTNFTVPIWVSSAQLGDSNIKRTLVYGAGNGGQYELNGNLKIFGESAGSGVAALFIEDSIEAKIQVRDIDAATSAINSEFEIKASDLFVTLGTSGLSQTDQLNISSQGSSGMRFGTETIGVQDYFCFQPSTAFAALRNWQYIFVSPLFPEAADDAAAGAAGIVTNQMYQTDGTGAAPLNVAGIVMIKQ